MTYRILFTGWREMKDYRPIRNAMLDYFEERPIPQSEVVLVHGAQRGLDSLVEEYGERWHYATDPHPADWDQYGKRAGRLRNEHMVKLGADICLAFPGPGSIGTWHCIRCAADAGIPVRIYPVKE